MLVSVGTILEINNLSQYKLDIAFVYCMQLNLKATIVTFVIGNGVTTCLSCLFNTLNMLWVYRGLSRNRVESGVSAGCRLHC